VLRRLAGDVFACLPLVGGPLLLLATASATTAVIAATAASLVLATAMLIIEGRLERALHRAAYWQSQARETAAALSTTRAELAAAHTDPVTGLAIRRVAERRLREATGREVTVALLDVDDLHGINDAHGHGGGDAYLAAVAQRLSSAAVDGDVIARLGGDEFVIITGRDPDSLARAVAAALAAPVALGAVQVPMRVSVGIYRGPGGDPHTLLGCADLAQYTAKRRRAGITFYDPARDGVPLRHGIRPTVRHRDRRRS